MLRRVFAVSVVAGLAAVLAACSPAPREDTFKLPAKARGQTCDTASANVVTFGRANAKLYSDMALKHQISELRGYMFANGLRRIQMVQKTSDCVAGSAGVLVVNGIYQCTARAQLCGQ